jgi:hypothetical protein
MQPATSAGLQQRLQTPAVGEGMDDQIEKHNKRRRDQRTMPEGMCADRASA